MKILRRRLILPLLLGVLTSIVVAWAGALLVDDPETLWKREFYVRKGVFQHLLSVERNAIVSIITTWTFDERGENPDGFSGSRIGSKPPPFPLAAWRWWFDHLPEDLRRHATFLEAGWPCRCLCGYMPEYEWVGAPRVTSVDEEFDEFDIRGRVPVHPIWIGMGINTLFYSSAWLGALICCTRIRCARRVARGECARCRYDLRGCTGSLCPECGWTRK